MNALLENINMINSRINILKKIVIKEKPIMIHVIGSIKTIEKGSYICTALNQIKTANQLGIPNDRIYVIYSKDSEPPDAKCKHIITRIDPANLNKPLPSDINIEYISKDNKFKKILKKILKKYNKYTPIIFGYDGHGYTESGNSNGNMPLHKVSFHKQIITDKNLPKIFKDVDRLNNPKIFIWSQCGSYDFVNRIKDKLPGFHLASTNGTNQCGFGAGIFKDFSYKLKRLIFGIQPQDVIDEYRAYPPPNLDNLIFRNYRQAFYNRDFYGVLTDRNVNEYTKIIDYLNLSSSG